MGLKEILDRLAGSAIPGHPNYNQTTIMAVGAAPAPAPAPVKVQAPGIAVTRAPWDAWKNGA